MAKISFWQLLKNCKVVIPIIQRDYAQGRVGKERIREKFLTQIKNALDDSRQSGELDFVYGTTKNDTFFPLDGLQRLTTLWLLHWFIASKAGKLNDAKEIFKKFSYETRTSSREFCKNLCEFDISNVYKVADVIQKQTWFYAAWKQDPTIQAMLRMLEGTDIKDDKGNDIIDGIEACFNGECNFSDLWNKLTGENCPIKFSKLEINSIELPVSDDLYIKMNARGKPLSDFENFKADLIALLKKEKENSAVKYGALIDNDWTDLFWDENEIELFDTKWMAFLCRFAVCMRIETSNDTEKNIAAILKDWRVYKDDTDESFSYEYKDFRDFQNIFDVGILERLEKIFSGWKKLRDFSLDSAWGDNFDFIPVRKEKSVSTLKMQTRVLFYGTMLFCEKCDKEDASLLDKWSDWKRIMWNLAENTNESSSLDSLVGVIKLFKELGEGCLNIYNYLIDSSSELKFNFEQLKEEIEKAKQIVDPPRDCKWNCCSPNRWKIQEAEKTAFFKGAIRFLYHNENGEIDWSHFDTKFGNAKQYFDANGVSDEYRKDAKLLRTFLANVEEINFWFGNGKEFWRNKVLLSGKYTDVISSLLSNTLIIKDDAPEWIKEQRLLADCIEKDGNSYGEWNLLRDWRCSKETLTRYTDRISGNVSHPARVIPLDHKRNELLKDFESPQKRGSRYFIGWTTDIDFEYKGLKFQWIADHPCKVVAANNKSFEVSDDCNKESFEEKLNELISLNK